MGKDDADDRPTESENLISVEVEDPYSPLTSSLLEMIENTPRLSPDCSIFRAPKPFRQLNEKAFNPSVVSIGPFHHGKEELQSMETLKVAYLNAFLTRTNIKLETCIKMIKEWENRIRNCYEEILIKFSSSDQFVKMILLDCCFLIEIIWRNYYDSDTEEADHQLSHRRIINNLQMDLLLLENQLPFFVLEGLFNLAYPNSIGTFECFNNLCVSFFGDLLIGANLDQALESITRQQPSEIKHLLDLLRICQAPSIPRGNPLENVEQLTMRKATELEQSGMVIKPGLRRRTGVTDIHYAPGVLEIPKLYITIYTEAVLRNLIVLEMCLYYSESYIADYVYFMDSLIDTTEDAELLIRQGIVASISSDSNEVATLFNSLRPYFYFPNYFYSDIKQQVNAYCEVPWHKWRASLRRDYCSSPWIIASTIAALILLILTFVQTVFSIISA